MATQKTYKTISRPYNNFLTRDTDARPVPASSTPTASGTTPASSSSSAVASATNGYVEPKTVRNDGSMDDLWIRTFIRSENWKPKQRGFYIDGRTGYAEFANVFLSGEIVAQSGYIGGFKIGATDISSTSGLYTTSISSGTVSFASGLTADPSVKIYREGKMELGALNPIILDGLNTQIRSDNYASGAFGRGFLLSSNLLEVGNIACRGLFRTAVFQKDIINVIAGSFVVSPNGDVLDVDMTPLETSTLTIKGTVTLIEGDILRMKEVNGVNIDNEWLRVLDNSAAPTYVVERDLEGMYDVDACPAWRKGTAVVDYGQEGAGGVYMTASEFDAPYLSVFTHAGSPWTDIDTKLRLGNLNGFLGYTSDLYGIGIGDSSQFLKYDSTNGLRIQGPITITNPEDIKTSEIDNDNEWSSDASLVTFINGQYTTDIDLIQQQLDGVTVSWFYRGEPTVLNEPEVNWTTEALKADHVGDLYYDLDTGYAWRYVLDGVYDWLRIEDTDVTRALEEAKAAQDTADSKRRVFIVQPSPPYDPGDLWITAPGNALGLLKKCYLGKSSGDFAETDWLVATEYTKGADWLTNLSNVPGTLAAPAGVPGLFLSASHMGYYTGGTWKSYIDNVGNMALGNFSTGGSGLYWNQTAATFSVRGAIYATSGTFAGSLSAATGTFSGALSAATGTFSGALSAATGTIGTITLSASGSISSNKTAYTDDTHPGFWLGIDGGASKFNIGVSPTKYFHYNGIDLEILGGTITGGRVQTGTAGYSIRLDSATNKLAFMSGTAERAYLTIDGDGDLRASATQDLKLMIGGNTRLKVSNDIVDISADLDVEDITATSITANDYYTSNGRGGNDLKVWVSDNKGGSADHYIQFYSGIMTDSGT